MGKVSRPSNAEPENAPYLRNGKAFKRGVRMEYADPHYRNGRWPQRI